MGNREDAHELVTWHANSAEYPVDVSGSDRVRHLNAERHRKAAASIEKMIKDIDEHCPHVWDESSHVAPMHPGPDWQKAERELSQAYLRLRGMIPGALDTPPAPTGPQVWETTENALRNMRSAIIEECARRLEELENDFVGREADNILHRAAAALRALKDGGAK